MAVIKPGHNSLNMEDISSDLRYVHHHVVKLGVDKRENSDIFKPVKEEYRNLVQRADDTDLVGGIVANRIAISTEEDRETVKNAKMIEGHGFGDLMSKKDANSLTNSYKLMSKNYNNEVASIRDELYQLKAELAKKGLVRNSSLHFGHTDIFRSGEIQYDYEIIGTPLEDIVEKDKIKLPVESVKKLDVGDYIVIYFKDAESTEVKQIKNISTNQEEITLDDAISYSFNATANNVVIYKTYGVVQNGNFYFAHDSSMKIGDTEYWSGLDDDTAYTFKRRINNTEQGFGYSFRIPENKRGYLTKFQIQARCTGTPTLSCCIIDEEDIGFFRNPDQAEALYKSKDLRSDGEPKMHFFARAIPVALDDSADKKVYTFSFWDSTTGAYPLINRDDSLDYRVRYVAIITATFANVNNYADIMFLQKAGNAGDLEHNNLVYQVNLKDEISPETALETSEELNASDMYYGISLKELVPISIKPLAQGLYTKTLKSNDIEGVARARLTLRIGREGGIWNADIASPMICGATTDNKSFSVECTPFGEIGNVSAMNLATQIRKPMELRKEPTDLYQYPDIIVSNNITSGSGAGVTIVTDDPILVKPKDMVYRNAYIVSVKGKRIEFNSETNEYETKETKKIYLKPIAIIADNDKSSTDSYSDRIIFEGDFLNEDGSLAFFNELELQIYWENSNLSDASNIRLKQMGTIRDLVFSIDRIAK